MPHFEFLVLLGLFIGAQAVTLDDLHEALNTNEQTWLTKRTYDLKGHTCVYTVKLSLNQTYYSFEQHFQKDGHKKKHTLYAGLGSDSTTTPWMEVSQNPGGAAGIKYFLQYWDKDEKCGILKVRLGGADRYEMHVWDSNVDGGKPKCEAEYTTLSGGKHSYEVYSKSCKTAAQGN
nr:uncharacterized protein LOC126538256 [Dermacentor andersoni]